MKIKWYAHSAFRLTTAGGVRIIIDPYESGCLGGAIRYQRLTDSADIVLISHDHPDHNYTEGIEGLFSEIDEEGSYDIKGVRIKAMPTFHDSVTGLKMGHNLMFVIEADGLKVVHLGDIGHTLDASMVAQVGKADVLMVPVGGVYTIDAKQATEVMRDLRASITMPMHFKTDKAGHTIAGVDQFLEGKERVRRIPADEIGITPESLPEKPEILILQYEN